MNLRCLPKLSVLSLLALGLLVPAAARATTVTDLVNVPNSTVTYTYTGLVATGASTELTFLGRQDPGFDSLTNVSLVDTSTSTDVVADGNFATGGLPWFTTQTNGNYPWGWGGGSASTGCVGPSCITGAPGELADLDQILATTIGDSYTLSFTYNPAGGTPTELEAVWGGAYTVTPEPDSLYLLGTGLVGLAGMIRRKLKA